MAKSKTEKEEKVVVPDSIAQPNPNDEDSQGHIKENARKGESVPVPNVIGPNPVTSPLDESEK